MRGVLSRRRLAGAGDDLVVRRSAVLVGLGGIVALIVIGRQFGLLAWPLIGAAAVMGFLAWRLYDSDGAEHSLLRAVVGRDPDRDRDLRP